jgi:ADP-ribose pyrophosphatase
VHEYQVLASEPVYEGRIISLRKDTVAMPGGGESVREVVHHPGAVGVVALDDQDRVVMLPVPAPGR